MVETVTSFVFGEVASRFRLRDQTAEGTCSLLCVRTWGIPCPESLGCIAALASFALLCFATLCVILAGRCMKVHEHFLYGWILFLLLQAGMRHLERKHYGCLFSLLALLCCVTLCFAMCCLRVVRFDVQVGDRDVKEAHRNITCVHDCAVEALRLKKKRTKTLSL